MISRSRDLVKMWHASVHRLHPIYLQKCLPNNITSAGSHQLTRAKCQQLETEANDWPCCICHLPVIKQAISSEITFWALYLFRASLHVGGDQDPGMRTFFSRTLKRGSRTVHLELQIARLRLVALDTFRDARPL